MGDRTAPNSQLRLEWVYGYRGHQTRSNLFYNNQDEIVYFVAGVGIVYNVKEKKQRFFLEHDDDIISLTMHPDNIQVATGQVGKAPQIIVWNSSDLKPTSILKGGHTDGVGILSFDSSAERLASCGIDQDSTIIIWDWRKGKILAKSAGHQERIFELKFQPGCDNQIVSCGVKQISFWKLVGNTIQKKKGLFGNNKNITTMFCLAFSNTDKETVYTGTIQGQIYIWKGQELKEIIPSVHASSIFQITTFNDGFLTAGKDDCIRTWDASFAPLETINLKLTMSHMSTADFFFPHELVIRSIFAKNNRLLIGTQSSEILEVNLANDDLSVNCLCKGHGEGELWSLAISPIDPEVFATASDDQTVRIWNLREKRLIKITELEKKIRSCSFSADGKHIACGLTDGLLVVINIEDMTQVYSKKNRNEVLHEIKYSPCGKFLAVGSNDNYVDILAVPSYKKVSVCSGNSSFITHVDWSKDSQYVQTNSGDGQRLIYKANNGKQYTNSEGIKKIEWQTFTGVLGSEVAGIWEKYTNKTDVNATDANFDEKCIVTGDDFGLVKLFRFPSLKKGAKFRKYVGHSSHVTNVRFTFDKNRVISIGGADHAIFQWRYISDTDSKSSTSNNNKLVNSHISMEGNEDVPEKFDAYLDTNSEDSDSEMSGKEIDSDIEKEKEISYDRKFYKEDLVTLKPILKEEIKKAEALVKRQTRPEVSLGIEFVFGYRGYDCRDNLFFIHDTGEMVYHVAALGIVYNKTAGVQRFYNEHSDDILCLSLHPFKNYVATGQIGRDPSIHIWDVETMKTLSILKGGHYRGVCSLSFSNDGKKLASVGLDDYHTICVWSWRKGEKLASTRGHSDKIFCIKWNPHSNESLVTVGVKHMKFWNQVGGGFTSNRGIFGAISAVETMMCIAFGKTPELCYTGGGNGSIFVWVNNKLSKMIEAHSGPIFAIYAHDQYEAYVTGGGDGRIILWNSQFSQIHKYDMKHSSLSKGSKGILLKESPAIRAICLASKKILVGTSSGEIIDIDKDGAIGIVIQGHGAGELWGLATHPKRLECCTFSDDQTLRIWDIEPGKRGLIKGKLFENAGRACEYSPDGKLIAIGFLNGTVCVLNSETLEVLETVKHRKEEISDIKFSPITGKYLAVGSHENFTDIYNVETHKRLGICKDSSSYITHVEWDVEGRLLMTNSGAKETLYYECPSGKRINIRQSDIEKITWSTFTSVLGPNCEGIWPPCTDVTDVNATCLTWDRTTLATGDDFGFVKLFQFPCPTKFAKFKRYSAHSSHVTNVRWTVNDQKLVSVGGNDTSVIIWNNNAFSMENSGSDVKSATSKSIANDLVLRNTRKGQSDDSDTDSEDEGYDSDVRREYAIDYLKNIFDIQIKRPPENAVKKMYEKVITSDKKELSKPSRNVKTKYKRTKINQMKNEQGKDVDPLTLMHFMAKITIAGDQAKGDAQSFKSDIKALNLSHIHGYRGFDCRDNLFYINNGTAIVYHAAAAGIVLDLAANTQSFYLEHTDDIISLCVNENPRFKNVIATGQIGKSSEIHVWDAITKETLSVLTGLVNGNEGVCSLGFSSSGKMLISVGLDENFTIGVWRWKEGSLVASASGDRKPNRIFKAMFRPDSDTVFVSVGFKHISFWNVAGSELIKRKGVLTDCNQTEKKLKKRPSMLSVAFGQENITYTGGVTGDVFIWKDNVLLRTVMNAHNGPIFTMHTSLFDGCIVTGAKEKSSKRVKEPGPIKLWDKDMKKVLKVYNLTEEVDVVKSVCRIKNKIIIGTKKSQIFEIQEKQGTITNIGQGHSEGELWGLATHPIKEIFCTASYDGFLKVWDIRSKKLRGSFNSKTEIRCCCFSHDASYLVIGCNDGEVILLKASADYDVIERIDSKRQRNSLIHDIKFCPNKDLIVVGYSDCSIDFFEVSEDHHSINRVGYCKQVPGPVLQIDWSTSGKFIKVGTSDYKTIVYDAPDGNEISSKELDSVEWFEWTSIFDPQIIGIWPEDTRKNYFNCAHLASNAMKLATGDDDGSVKLFKFPSTEKSEPVCVKYGHSSFVTNLKFLNNNTHLMSIGGLDCCIFVWECQ